MQQRRTWGSVSQLPSGNWRARYSVNHTRHRAPHTFPTAEEGTRWLEEQHARIVLGTWQDPVLGNRTLDEWITLWLPTHHVADTTRALYRRDLDRWILPPLGPPPAVSLGTTPLNSITPVLVRHWYSLMCQKTGQAAIPRRHASAGIHPARWWARQQGIPTADTGRISPRIHHAWTNAGAPTPPVPRAPAGPGTPGGESAARIYRLLHTVMQAATDDGLITTNPVHIKGASTTTPIDRQEITRTEADLIRTALPPRYRAAFTFALITGLRAGQIFAIRRTDIDFHHHRVYTGNHLTQHPGHPLTIEPIPPRATKHARHWLPLTPPLATLLRTHLEQFTPNTPLTPVFCTLNGTPLHPSNRTHWFHKARRAAGRPDIRWHDLRAASAMFLYDHGATTTDVQHHLDHATPHAALRYQRTSEQRHHAHATLLAQEFIPTDPTDPN